MIEWYKKYRIKKTILKKMGELKLYIRPGYNVGNTAKRITEIYAEILALKEELK